MSGVVFSLRGSEKRANCEECEAPVSLLRPSRETWIRLERLE